MRITQQIKYLLFVVIVLNAQQVFQIIESIPDEFVEKYYSERHEYNPLHLSDYWQYASESGFLIEYIEKDTVVNNQQYFKKYDYREEFRKEDYFFKWERNDTIKNCTFMLDNEDLDNDGYTDDELMLDSLEIPNYHEYLSYRRTWKNDYSNYPSNALLVDSSWIIIFNDTVMSRYVSYTDHFYEERVADKYGVVFMQPEASEPIILTGTIIDTVQFGNIVSVQKQDFVYQPKKSELFQNYPNPFNSETTIEYYLPQAGDIELSIFDIHGKKFETILSELEGPGHHKIKWNANHLSSGVYFYKLKSDAFSQTRKFLLIK